MSTDFASANLTVGQLNAIVKKLGGHDGALRFLRDELVVSEQVKRWTRRSKRWVCGTSLPCTNPSFLAAIRASLRRIATLAVVGSVRAASVLAAGGLVSTGSRSLPRKCLSAWFSKPRVLSTLFLSPLYNCAVSMLKVNIRCGVFLFHQKKLDAYASSFLLYRNVIQLFCAFPREFVNFFHGIGDFFAFDDDS